MKTLIPLFALFALSCSALALEKPLVIDTGASRVEAAVSSTFDDFNVALSSYEALVSVDTAGKRIGSVQFRFRFANVKTGDRERDSTMRKWQNTDQFPDCVYTVDSLVPLGAGQYQAHGRLLLHGNTQTLAFPVRVTFDGDACTIDGTFPLDTRSHGLPVHRRYGLLRVDPVIQVTFHLTGKATPGA